MYAQLFGAYLLNNNVVTSDQLKNALSEISKVHIKLGTLAISKGLMTSQEVDRVCLLQTQEDKRFGELAVEKGYLTEDQVTELLHSQNPDYLLLGQTLVDQGAINNTQLETLLLDYQADAEIDEYELENSDRTQKLINRFLMMTNMVASSNTIMYLNLLFNNLIRFIGSDYTPLAPVPIEEYPTNYCVLQKVVGDLNFETRIDISEDAAIQFATRYAKMDFTEFDDYVKASLEDFMNLHNGLFTVNISNDSSLNLTLEPPMHEDTEMLILEGQSYVIPVIYPFGTVNFIVSL